MGRRDFEQETTISPKTSVVITYKAPKAGGTKPAVYGFTPYSVTTTSYTVYHYRDFQTGEWRDAEVASRRESLTYSIAAAVNGDIIRALLSNDIPCNGSLSSFTKSETAYEYELLSGGPAVGKETVTEYQSEVAFAGALSVGDQYVIARVPVILSNAFIKTSVTITETRVDETQGITTTKTSRWLAFGLTSEGSVSCRAQIAAADNAGEVADVISAATALVFDGSEIRSSLGRDYGAQYRPSERLNNIDRVPGGQETLSTVSTNFDTGLGNTDNLVGNFDYNLGGNLDYNFSNDAPSSPVVGDVWVGSDGIEKAWDGTAWVASPIDLPIGGEFDDKTITISDTAPANPQIGDRWTSPSNLIEYEWNGTAWVPVNDATPDVVTVSPTAPTNPAYGDKWCDPVTDVTSVWDGKSWESSLPPSTEPVVTISKTPPTSPAVDDRWIDPKTSVEYRWDGSAFVVLDPAVDPGMDVTITVSPTAPSSPAVHDRWVNPDTGKESRWTGTAWLETGDSGVLYDGPPLTVSATAPASPATDDRWIDPRIGTEYVWTGSEWRSQDEPYPEDTTDLIVSGAAPSSPVTAQQWLDTMTGRRKEWNGSAWVVVGTEEYGGLFDSGLSGLSGSEDLTVLSIDVPYPPDFVVVTQPDGAGNVLEWLISDDAIAEARELAMLTSTLAFGHAYGTNVVLEPWLVPTVPLTPFKVEAGGLRVSYLANSVSWEWNADSMVAGIDGLLIGVDGKLSGQTVRPWVLSRVPLTDLPTVSPASTNTDSQPANTIVKPRNLNPATPGAFHLRLPTNGVDVFPATATSTPVVFPFSPCVEADLAVTTSISVESFNYTIGLRTDDIGLTSRTEITIVFAAGIDHGTYAITGYDIESLWVVSAAIATGVYDITGYDIASEVV